MKLYSQLAIVVSICIYMTVSTYDFGYAQSQRPITRNWATERGWKTATWNTNDKSYQQMRTTIDNAISSGRKPQDLVGLYAQKARQMPNDAKAQFCWAYAAYMEARQTDYNHGENIIGEPRSALILAPFPHNIEYARLIFLTIGYLGMPYGSQLETVSKRMVLNFPTDGDVKYTAANNLIYSDNLAYRHLGLIYIKELIKSEPHKASPHALLGAFHYAHWQMNKNRDDASEATANYQQYLQLTTLDDPFRQRAQQIIAEIKNG
jgi:hypothetical protein